MSRVGLQVMVMVMIMISVVMVMVMMGGVTGFLVEVLGRGEVWCWVLLRILVRV